MFVVGAAGNVRGQPSCFLRNCRAAKIPAQVFSRAGALAKRYEQGFFTPNVKIIASYDTLGFGPGELEGYGEPCDVTSLSLEGTD